MRLFSNDTEGYFVERPNRFIVTAETPGGIIRAHCPNPGRMQELLVPGRRLIFSRSTNPERKTPFTLEAVYYQGKVVPLYAAHANRIAAELIIPLLYPAADAVLPEQKQGNSRFDFLVIHGTRRTFLEVKACSLVEEGRGMFPDAPTERGRRHIRELAECRGHLLFIIMHPDAELFSPNIHTDPRFAKVLLEVSKDITIDAASVSCTAAGEVTLRNLHIPVDLSPVKYVLEDSGAYLILMKLETDKTIAVGKLGTLTFTRGYYVYTGSAKRNLSKRIKRHLTKKKKAFHWHIDYLSAEADSLISFPLYTGKDIECPLARDLEKIADTSIPGFGSSDCSCPSHLFHFKADPGAADPFQQVLHRYRHNP